GLLGRQHCIALAEAGASVIACDLSAGSCNELVSSLPGEHYSFSLDVTSQRSLEDLEQFILSVYGRLDILVNNAAINDKFESPALAAENSRFENYPLELWQKSIDVNITGSFLCSRILGRMMVQQGSGSIINIASTYGIVAPDQSLYQNEAGAQLFYKTASYPVTKGAILSLTTFLAAYWGAKGVRVNSLSPGGVENGQDRFFVNKYSLRTPLGRMARPDDYRGALVFLASDASSYMTGANLVVDGGYTIW
ncbi:MAG: SDR family oxidoreductase, partial [Ignavibacteriales bacterium]|nr:SDR family oxidoreductase [Ignavibacteriales bacterium]